MKSIFFLAVGLMTSFAFAGEAKKATGSIKREPSTYNLCQQVDNMDDATAVVARCSGAWTIFGTETTSVACCHPNPANSIGNGLGGSGSGSGGGGGR